MDVFAAAALDRLDHLERPLDGDPGLANARFRTVRTGPQETLPNDWATPLWFAAVNGRAGVISYLLNSGADRAVSDPEGKSIAEHARDQGRAEIADLLEANKSGEGR
ncbi:hypothetical protein [uncultured Marivita sp.]|uniref:hypothetical protein n=1 Tax=uncultured Marivita sp. TaxID=888080 RepID=UPI00260D1425|nr:hypothetical protein [uncultured Marivita sp.]